jgi:hypothetical protein
MFNHTVREGETVTLVKSAELFQGQEVHAGDVGTVRYVFDDSVSVRFEVVSDVTGAEYYDSISVDLDELGEMFEEFEWIDE